MKMTHRPALLGSYREKGVEIRNEETERNDERADRWDGPSEKSQNTNQHHQECRNHRVMNTLQDCTSILTPHS